MHFCYCPYCGASLTVKDLEVEKTASICPSCRNTVILTDYGASISRAYVYVCQKCGDKSIYLTPPPFVTCDRCGTLYRTTPTETCMIPEDLYQKGEAGSFEYKKKPDRVVARRNKWRALSPMKKIGIIAGIIALIGLSVLLYVRSLPAAIEDTKAYAEMDSFVKEFRSKNPYNTQLVGIRSFDDNSYLILLTEPSAKTTYDALEKSLKRYNHTSRVYKTGVGVDGWLKDLVICVNGVKEKKLPKLAATISNQLHHTSYKADFLNLDSIPEHVAFSDQNLNVQVSEEELHQWFVTDKEPLVYYDDMDKTTTIEECLSNSLPNGMQLLMSKEPGFVVWVLDRSLHNSALFDEMAYKFSLDADLIFGAIANSRRVAIIGRERCVSVFELPPMRVETLRILASADDDELAQSYERNSLYAGKMPGGKDFAPIYLSPQLWHTEYGSLLNVTDQMLKSWSENGMIDYVNFNYPKPVEWAFNEGVLRDLEVNTLTYNWNTAGVGYIVDDGEYEIYAVNRTGSLPVSYIPGDSEGISADDPVYVAEETAYDFFSGLSSPELVKVVQYAAMYQIFHNMGVSVAADYVNENQLVSIPLSLKDNAAGLLKSLAVLSKSDRQALATYIDEDLLVVDYDEYARSSKYRYGFVMPNRLVATFKGSSIDDVLSLSYYKNVIAKLDTVSKILDQLNGDQTLMNSFATLLMDRDADIEWEEPSSRWQSITLPTTIPTITPLTGKDPGFVTINLPSFDSKRDKVEYAYIAIMKYQREIKTFRRATSDLSAREAYDAYLDSNKGKSSNWIKCPTLVLSWSLTDSISYEGGHNLDSKVSRFRVNRSLERGKTVRGKDGVLEISLADAKGRVGDPNYLRRYGRLADANISGKDIPVRPKKEVVGLAAKRSGRGLTKTDHMTVKLGAKNTVNGREMSLREMFETIGNELSTGKGVEFKEIEITGFDKAGVKVDVIVDGVKTTMLRGDGTSLAKSCFDIDHYTVVYEGERAKVRFPIKSNKVVMGSTSNAVIEAGMGGAPRPEKVVFEVKEGIVEFNVPKNKVEQFIQAVRDYLKEKSEQWNRFQMNRRLKKYDINPEDCFERDYFKVAHQIKGNKTHDNDYDWIIQEARLA